jgi:COMPASS component SWD2
MDDSKRKLSSDMTNFGLAQVFHDNTSRINSMSFRADGEMLVTSANDESLHLYDTSRGVLKQTLQAKKYGVGVVKFTHSASCVITASNNDSWDDTLRYLSLHDNRYLRYFSGHTAKVTSVEVSPVEDVVLSGSEDKSVRLWDLRSTHCAGLLKTPDTPCVAFDPTGILFAAAVGKNLIKLYAMSGFDKGPFATFHINGPPFDVVSLSFSPDGKFILASTTQNQIFLVDSFSGNLVKAFEPTKSLDQASSIRGVQACFSPDGAYVCSGSQEGPVHVWDSLSGKEVATWNGHSLPSKVIAWNPTKLMVASADTSLAFWLPTLS